MQLPAHMTIFSVSVMKTPSRPRPKKNVLRVKRRALKRQAQHRSLMPVMRPSQNMRDIIKQMLLLEDHLYHAEKRCSDCIRKHFLTIEALAEECTSLCKPTNILPEARALTSLMRVLHHAWEQQPKNGALMERIASRIRKTRKALMKKYAALPIEKLPSAETNKVNAMLK